MGRLERQEAVALKGHRRKGALRKQPSFSWSRKAKGIFREEVKDIGTGY